jgi:rubrerythrin
VGAQAGELLDPERVTVIPHSSALDNAGRDGNTPLQSDGALLHCRNQGGAMKQWDSVDEILDYAIGQEEQAVDFYTDLAARVEKPWVRKIFEDYAEEERGHKRKLLAIKEGKLLHSDERVVDDLKIADYLVDASPDISMGYRDALILAMKKEKAAFKLYNDLATASSDSQIRETFQNLAQEEAKHKLRFELEYDDAIQSAN